MIHRSRGRSLPLRRLGTALLALLLAACSTLPSDGARSAARHRDTLTGEHRVGIALGHFSPRVQLDAEVSGKGGGALHGAGHGALACLELEKGSSGPGTGLITLICLPFGAAVGAVLGASSSASGEAIVAGHGRLDQRLATVDLQAALGRALEHYADKTDLRAQLYPLAEGPSRPADTPTYPASTDYVIEAAVIEARVVTTGANALPYGLLFEVHARLIRNMDGSTVDTLTLRTSTPLRTVDEWLADQGGAMARAIDAALAEAAEAIIDEWMLVHRGDPPAAGKPATPSDGERPRVPEYALQPLTPPLRVERRFLKRPLLPGHLEPVAVSTTPRFAWEAWPRDLAPADADATAVPVIYDLRLYDAGPFPIEGVAAAQLVQEHFGLPQPGFTPQRPLQPCSYYFWTVRARFLLEGRMRATEWTGAYRSIGGTVDPTWSRRGEWPLMMAEWPNRWFYLPILTAPTDGRRCP
ncbi:hypothetical protein [Azoarcus olearius]|uniref:Hypothetical secreted protein n=1 Tax=Azoarcus sp. (strain BH72) TaxID=418699 RepID=A1K7Q9_AZOSB|nr:hypothetical protein [Azoarcus olearius]CAL94864.1 hypothetical secreted protein [Azoarcus olearius]